MHHPPLVLIADDEPETIGLLERLCRRCGYETQVASDGLQAYALSEKLLPDLILLDIQMPHLDGFEVMRRLRQTPQTRLIPIIVITASATTPHDAARGLDIGADDFLLKPFNTQELAARMRAKIRARDLEQRLQQRSAQLEALVLLGIELKQQTDLHALALTLLDFVGQVLKGQARFLSVLETENNAGFTLYTQGNDYQYTPKAFYSAERSLFMLGPAEEQIDFWPSLSGQPLTVLPLLQDEQVIGFLGGVYGQQEEPNFSFLLNLVSQQATLAIRNIQLHQATKAYAEDLEARVQERTEKLVAAQEQLLRAEKLALLGRLSGEIAHEIKTPLTPLTLNLERMLEDIRSGRNPDAQDLQEALNEAHRLNRIANSLLDFARPDAQGMRPVNLRELLEQVLKFMRKSLQKNQIRVQTDTDFDDLPLIQANPDQLRQVFLNLIVNAIQAMEGRPRRDLNLKLEKAQSIVKVQVADSGYGISEEFLSHIFEPLFSRKGSSGFGLSISRNIVEAHGGQIQVSSQLNQGTIFTVSLPLNHS
jgi:signal transduction histidine kinase